MTTLEKIRAEIAKKFFEHGFGNTKVCYEVLQILDKYTEQEPCTDAISRQAVLASIKNLYPDMPIVDIFGARRKWLEKYAPYFECENAVEQLPPVRPQQEIIRCGQCK